MFGVKIFVSLLVMTTLMIPLLLNCKEKITSLLGMAENGVFCCFFFSKSRFRIFLFCFRRELKFVWRPHVCWDKDSPARWLGRHLVCALLHPSYSFGAQRILKADQAWTLTLTVDWFAGRAGEERGGGGERHTRKASVEPGCWCRDDSSCFSCTFLSPAAGGCKACAGLQSCGRVCCWQWLLRLSRPV